MTSFLAILLLAVLAESSADHHENHRRSVRRARRRLPGGGETAPLVSQPDTLESKAIVEGCRNRGLPTEIGQMIGEFTLTPKPKPNNNGVEKESASMTYFWRPFSWVAPIGAVVGSYAGWVLASQSLPGTNAWPTMLSVVVTFAFLVLFVRVVIGWLRVR